MRLLDLAPNIVLALAADTRLNIVWINRLGQYLEVIAPARENPLFDVATIAMVIGNHLGKPWSTGCCGCARRWAGSRWTGGARCRGSAISSSTRNSKKEKIRSDGVLGLWMAAVFGPRRRDYRCQAGA